MRVLITGAHGQLGHDLMDAFSGQLPAGGDAALGCDLRGGHQQHEVFGFGPGELDVTDASAVISVMNDLKPDCVVHAAAYTAVDAAETDGDRVDHVNVQGTQHVLEAAEVQKARFITFSTDYVFDGGKADAYEEDDLVSPLNRYGLSKAKAETIVGERGLVIRSSWLAGVHGQPTVLKAVKRVGEGKSVKFVSDQVGSFTACADLAAATTALAEMDATGLIHVANQGSVSWFELVRFAVQSAGLDPHFVAPTTTQALGLTAAAKRPKNSALATKRAKSLGLSLPEWQNGIARLVSAAHIDPKP